MALINCPECNHEISDKASSCPNCGCPIIGTQDEEKEVIHENMANGRETELASEALGIENENFDIPEPSESKAKNEKFYSKTWFIILILIIFFPIGVFLMWKEKKFHIIARIILSAILGLWFAFWLLVFIVFVMPCPHEWEEATCTEPKVCTICGETEGEPLGHSKGDWELTEEATLVDVGVEEVFCTRCYESLDSRGTERKNPKVIDNSFNFTDEELIDWLNDIAKFEVGYTDVGDFDSDNTMYRIDYDGEAGGLILNHGENGKDGDVCAIMVWFDEWSTSVVISAWIGEQIDSDFSANDSFVYIATGDSYTKANMTLVDIDDFVVLAPSEFIAEMFE